ncbi:MAG TPA: glycosyltransferase family 9 protein [Pyrinomonadaceae bacterium]|jgi:ADP-heptose:LPS heptosyltransferase|nr:glycosyltransferase family 9 protein [Pyrinomonadaceae bacterium]
MTFDPRNILVIDFGQLGDVVLSLPALAAIRKRFPRARITVAVGKPGAEIIALSGLADETLVVDRVALRDGFKPLSVFRVFKIVKDVRQKKFDFVIDLHSLSETNLLGFLSGAPKRLYSRRPGRSLDYLANFRPRPPVETDHRKRHLIDRYLDVLIPLEIEKAERIPVLKTRPSDAVSVERILMKAKADAGAPLVGVFPGAGHPSRRWPLEQFANLADHLVRNDQVRVLVFLGPEERAFLNDVRRQFPPSTIILDRLTIPELAAAQARLAAFVSNDTGPMHLASAVGTPVVLLLDKRAPESYLPQGDRHRVIYNSVIEDISVDEVYAATRSILASGRTAALFAS